MKACPWCKQEPEVGNKPVDIGGGICRRVFFVRCVTAECPIKPSTYVEGQCGYKHLDKMTDREAERLSKRNWNIR